MRQSSQNSNALSRTILLLAVAGLIISLLSLVFNWSRTPKIAFIKSEEVLSKYKGMQEARAKFEDKAKSWQANTDTLRMKFEDALKDYEKASATMNAAAKAQKEKELRGQQAEYGKYNDAIGKQAEEENKKLTESVLAQVNAFLKVYGEKQGYDILFGAGGGSIVHGADAYDITDEVILELNKQYEGK